MKLVRQDQRVSSISSTWEPLSASFDQFRLPRTPIKVERAFGKQTDIPHSILFPIQVPINLPRTVFLTLVHQMASVQICREEPLGLRCLTSASWSPRNIIHHFCWCHLRRRRALKKKKKKLHWFQTRPLQCHLGTRLVLCIFGAWVPTRQTEKTRKSITIAKSELSLCLLVLPE